jgi:hypothetical protein
VGGAMGVAIGDYVLEHVLLPLKGEEEGEE